ncbi:MAG: flagellar FlbD family protein [Syntrophomonadaceae bacterium]|nr:flagellar FlbD family protein [Syntrophomonadaceae bacterium]
MIQLTGMDNKVFIINAEMIERLESMPETLITLINGKRVLVQEGIDVVRCRIIDYRRAVNGVRRRYCAPAR